MDALKKHKHVRIKKEIVMHFKKRNLWIQADINTTYVVIQIIT